jgi:hypothetical protein
MRGKRVVKVRCPVEGHARCEVTNFATPPDRTVEKRGWITEAIEEARQACEDMPPDILEAALRSGTAATVGVRDDRMLPR